MNCWQSVVYNRSVQKKYLFQLELDQEAAENRKFQGHRLVILYTLMMSHCFSQSHCLMPPCILASVH